ncbi:MAG TPA: cupin domain-containing protein [Ktedonobacterales bacterium]|nr:cupin domain-containing protein [Ktedonobacterales bacterium]
MAGIEQKSFASPDEIRTPPKARMEIVTLDGRPVVKATYSPGWRWSVDTAPVVGGDSCQLTHFAYVLSGRMRARLNDGAEMEAGPGDVVFIQPGHDGWTIGDEPCVILDFGGALNK